MFMDVHGILALSKRPFRRAWYESRQMEIKRSPAQRGRGLGLVLDGEEVESVSMRVSQLERNGFRVVRCKDGGV